MVNDLVKMTAWTHLIRFIAKEDGSIHLGQPIDTSRDIGLDIRKGSQPRAYIINGSIFGGQLTDVVMTVSQLLSPISKEDCNFIRCIGMNYKDHAKVSRRFKNGVRRSMSSSVLTKDLGD